MGCMNSLALASTGLILSLKLGSTLCTDDVSAPQTETFVGRVDYGSVSSELEYDRSYLFFDDASSSSFREGYRTNFKTNILEDRSDVGESTEKSSQQERMIRSSSLNEGDTSDGVDNVDILPKTLKSRRHQLRRKMQVCEVNCFTDADCDTNASTYPECNAFRTCNGSGLCQGGSSGYYNGYYSDNRSGFRCNWNCQNNFSICSGASDGCSHCNGFQCTRGPNRQRCGQFCSYDPSICNDATDGCTTCNGSTCSGNRGGLKCGWNCQGNRGICNGAADGCFRCDGFRCVDSGGGQPRCGEMCRYNPNICNGATDGCNTCNGSTGTCNSGGRPTCGSRCSNVNSCLDALNGCTQCLNGVCDSNRSGGGACESTEAGLRARLENGGTVEICPNARIVVSSQITTNRNNILLQCQGGGTGCAIVGPTGGQNRLIRFTGQSIELRGITFENGFSTQSGGAVYIDGNNNRITNCNFVGNRANQQGGAASVGSTTFAGNTFSGNFASQCLNVMQRQTGQCFG